MTDEMPYMASVANLSEIISKLRGAGTPPRFTHEFLASTLGFRSSNDRGVIKLLKALGMLMTDGTPTPRYNEFKSESTGGVAMAEGLREGWSPLFMADTQAYDRSTSELQDTFKTVTGKGDAVAKKMATTFKALAVYADFNAAPTVRGLPDDERPGNSDQPVVDSPQPDAVPVPLATTLSLRHDVHIHLPPTSDAAVYTAIFRALREELLE